MHEHGIVAVQDFNVTEARTPLHTAPHLARAVRQDRPHGNRALYRRIHFAEGMLDPLDVNVAVGLDVHGPHSASEGTANARIVHERQLRQQHMFGQQIGGRAVEPNCANF